MKKNIYIYRSFAMLISAVCIICGLVACKDFLEIKPDKKMVLPSTLLDCQALLDNYIIMNINYPSNELAADNYYLNLTSVNNLPVIQRDGYIWKADADQNHLSWQNTYQRILYANQVLETLAGITPVTAADQALWFELRGAALFFRGFCFYQLAQFWSKPYDAATADTDLGIPLRLSADISEPTVRATVKETYDRVLRDLEEAANLLTVTKPTSIVTKNRPGKTAAYALLARVYLSMGDYTKAFDNADKGLKNYSTLIDYNGLSTTAAFPFLRYNDEVIFHAVSIAVTPILSSTNAKVDSNLYRSYQTNDLRRNIFFRANTGTNAGTFFYKGNYDGSNSLFQFCGLTTDELYLVRAETYARNGNATAAMTDLNTLLRKRWLTGTYTDMTATNADDALVKILVERRKELLFRGLRWTDLGRLNKDPKFAVTLTRVVDGVTYTIPPNDPRYALLIPSEVLKREQMPQNPR